MKTFLGFAIMGLALVSGLVGVALWLTAEDRMTNDATVALVYVRAGFILTLTGGALLIDARRVDAQ